MRALRLIGALALPVALIASTTAPATAQGQVTVSNDRGTAQADINYGTTLSLSGSGFQSIQGGFGGIYVFFGIREGDGYLYIPDSESKDNAGYQRFIAFPGSETESAAHGVINADGTWQTSLNVPGATFQVTNRSGENVTVDCLQQTCGVITIGAHGVQNANNTTFTPVEFTDLYGAEGAPSGGGEQPSGGGGQEAPSGAGPEDSTEDGDAADAQQGEATGLQIDLETAVVGRVMSFTADGFTAGEQVLASLDDGVAASGPFTAGSDGRIAGLIDLPAHLTPGTHQLRVTGASSQHELTSTFAVKADVSLVADTERSWPTWTPYAFLGVAVVVLAAAVAFTIWRIRRTVRSSRGAPDAI